MVAAREAFAAEDTLRAFVFTDTDKTLDVLDLFLVNNRTNFRPCLRAVTDDKLRCALFKLCNELIMNRFMQDKT